MFPFNQAYKPRQISPVASVQGHDSPDEPPMTHLSIRPRKRSRKTPRFSPYPQRTTATLSPHPSEVEFEHGEQSTEEPIRESPDFYKQESVACANPQELMEQPEITPPTEPLKWGDLVVVHYAEKKKAYPWPAIVHTV